MITPQLKDEILSFIVNNSPDLVYSSSLEELADRFATNENVMNAILYQFGTKGLIKYQPFLGGDFMIQIGADAHDYLLKGGHLGEFENLEMQVQKLKNDLYSFESSIPEGKFKSIKETLGLILTAASTYKSFQ